MPCQPRVVRAVSAVCCVRRVPCQPCAMSVTCCVRGVPCQVARGVCRVAYQSHAVPAACCVRCVPCPSRGVSTACRASRVSVARRVGYVLCPSRSVSSRAPGHLCHQTCSMSAKDLLRRLIRPRQRQHTRQVVLQDASCALIQRVACCDRLAAVDDMNRGSCGRRERSAPALVLSLCAKV